MTTEQANDRPRGLTREEFLARKPCPGCGRPLLDEERWESKGTMYFTDDERARYEAEEARYKKLHGDCHEVRWSIEGSLTMHCAKCCPPTPLSPRQKEEIGRLLSSIRRSREASIKARPVRELRRRTVEVYDDEWTKAKSVATSKGEDISSVVRRAIAEYVETYGADASGK